MVTTQRRAAVKTRRFVNWFVDGVERAGNRLPEPFALFVLLFTAIAVISTAMAAFGVSTRVPGAEEATPVQGLFSADGLTWLTTNWVDNFVGFPPLGVVLTLLMAVGIAQRTGMLTALIRRVFGRSPRWLLPYVVGLVAGVASFMSDASVIVVPPLAAMVFKAAGRHPVAGLLGAYATATAGFSVSPFVTSTDALLSGITSAAAESLPDAGTAVTPVSNYFLIAPMSIVLALVSGLLIDKVLEPALNRRRVPRETTAEDESGSGASEDRPDLRMDAHLEPRERRGLRWAGCALLITMAAVLALTLPPGAPMRGENGGFLPSSPLLDSVVFLVFLALVTPGLIYGLVTRTITGSADIAGMVGGSIKDMSGFVVIVFVLAQFLALFKWSGLSTWLAVSGANLLDKANFTGFAAIVAFILLAGLINLFIGSGSAQWTLFAAVFVPMFALLGYEPGFVQAAFRIGDSTTNAISPLSPYIVVILGFLRAYEPKAGLGTIIARAFPFTAVFLVIWMAFLTVYYLAGIPVGPGTGSHL
ncbi:AbgT family transporter [Prauserella halophila]|uniref:AbgT family transporter n=1 Tax=Prauserella halophila TaxID=185641 RepID=A0ABN1W501_9PSEU|nr:AbgT family transporter [Prauserella halophila]MCP2236231.1 aminobenzoyl-glutamate transport protein [Prauserella halophila]